MDAAATKWIQTIEERVQVLETQISVDRFKAEQERTRRENRKEAAKAERLTVRVKVADDGTLIAENVRDPIKFNALVKKKIIEKVVHVSDPHRGEWIVNRGAANREGYIVIEVS